MVVCFQFIKFKYGVRIFSYDDGWNFFVAVVIINQEFSEFVQVFDVFWCGDEFFGSDVRVGISEVNCFFCFVVKLMSIFVIFVVIKCNVVIVVFFKL